MPVVFKDFVPAVFGNVLCDQNELEIAFAASQYVPTDDQNAGAQYETEQLLRGLNNILFLHSGIVTLCPRDRAPSSIDN